MGYFPFFIELKGKQGLIVGGGNVAERKISKLLLYEPQLVVVAEHISTAIKKMEKDMGAANIILQERLFCEEDLEGKDFVIVATSDERLNAGIAQLCNEKHILVNVVDDMEKCGFLFPSVIRKGRLSVGVSTEGASPRIASELRSRISMDVPERMEEILDYLNHIRPYAKEVITDEKQRAAFLMELADECMRLGRALTEAERKHIFEKYQKKTGKVVLVGAGCLSFEYITLRGMQEIRRAQVLVYDALIDEHLLDYATENCEKICVGKRSGRHSMKQEEIQKLLLKKAQEGNYVVRLKGGDPFVFGRGREEMDVLLKAGIEVEVVPGISSCIAIPELAGIPVTERQVSRSFHVMTGHFEGEEDDLNEEIRKMAAMNGTSVFLMGYTRLGQIVEELQKGGADASTPAAVIHGTTDGNCVAAYGTLGTIEKTVEKKKSQCRQ